MIDPANFIQFLNSKGFNFFTGVPCSYFKQVIRCLENQKNPSYYIAPNEGSALALASGAHLAGQGAVVMIQNSGLGNLINPLTSLNMIYDLPVLLLVSGRAYGIPDEPQHEIMGSKMGDLLSSLEIPSWDLPQENDSYEKALTEGIRLMRSRKKPVVFFVRKGTFSAYEIPPSKKSNVQPAYEMKRMDALRTISEALSKEDLVFATTGKISREFFTVADRPGNFYMQGSMGHISSVALGAALVHPDKRVIVLDGDGAFLMHMGSASMIGHYRPENFVHLVLDNESYETTGDQDTTSPTTDFEAVAKACGYSAVFSTTGQKDLKEILPKLFAQKGPALLRIKINRLETKDIPRITSRYSAPQITENFMNAAANAPAVLRS